MKMKTVGYFDGIDSVLLTKIAASGFCTMPLGNEWDNHGKIAGNLQPGEVDLIISPLYKILPPAGFVERVIPYTMDLLYPAKVSNIPVLVIVPEEFHEKGKNLLGEVAEFVKIVTPDSLEEAVREILEF